MSFAKRLKAARESAELSQAAVAKQIFITQPAYAKYELGTSSPNPETLKRISEVLGMNTDYFLTRSVEWHKSYYEDYERAGSDEERLEIFIEAGVPDDLLKEYCILSRYAVAKQKKPSAEVIDEELDKNVLVIRGSDGRYIRKKLTDEEIKSLEILLKSLPDVSDDV